MRVADPDHPVSKEQERWERETRGQGRKRAPERLAEFVTGSGAPVAPLYTPATNQTAYLSDLGFPGEYPFTRGVQPTMYRGRHWTMRQYAGFGTAAESNARYRYLLEQGQTGLSVAFDLPTQIGYDSDHVLAAGEVGKVGVAIDSLADMEVLFADIPLDRVSTSMTINAPAAVLLAMYAAVAKKQGVPVARLQGTIQNDILKEYAARGTYIFPPGPSMRIITDIFAYCAKEMPEFNTISISGYHIREAGSTAVQELAFTLANAIAYVEAARAAGLSVDTFAPRLSFFWSAHNDFFEEIAKFRVARRLWARVMRGRFGSQNPRSQMMRFHVQTAGSTLTAQQPENNIVRVAVQAMAAVLGGCQSLHTNSFDEALALPTEKSVRLALRTQQVLGFESGLTETVDPLGGSYYVESLCAAIEQGVMAYIDRIDAMGGAVSAVEQGFIQREIQVSAYRHQREVEAGQRVVVGVNRFQSSEAPPEDLLRIDPDVGRRQVERLQQVRQSRDPAAVARHLEALRAAATGTDNLMPPIFNCVWAYATIGEICDVLRGIFGEYQPEVSL